MDINKILKKLPTGYAEDVQGYSEEKLRQEIIQAESNIARLNAEQESDDKLNGAKELVKDLTEPYKAAKSAQRAKIDYVMIQLDEQGRLPAPNVSAKDDEDE